MQSVKYISFFSVDIINRVRSGESIPFRPVLPESSDLGKPVLDLIRSCWNEEPTQRPTFKEIRRTVTTLAGGRYRRKKLQEISCTQERVCLAYSGRGAI